MKRRYQSGGEKRPREAAALCPTRRRLSSVQVTNQVTKFRLSAHTTLIVVDSCSHHGMQQSSLQYSRKIRISYRLLCAKLRRPLYKLAYFFVKLHDCVIIRSTVIQFVSILNDAVWSYHRIFVQFTIADSRQVLMNTWARENKNWLSPSTLIFQESKEKFEPWQSYQNKHLLKYSAGSSIDQYVSYARADFLTTVCI